MFVNIIKSIIAEFEFEFESFSKFLRLENVFRTAKKLLKTDDSQGSCQPRSSFSSFLEKGRKEERGP